MNRRGEQHTPYDTAGVNEDGTLQDPHNPDQDNATDDVSGPTLSAHPQRGSMTSSTASWRHRQRRNSDIDYQQEILGKPCRRTTSTATISAVMLLGAAQTWLQVSFGADGRAQGNDQAGLTKFQHDSNSAPDTSSPTHFADGTESSQAGTDKQAFELFMQKSGGEAGKALADAFCRPTGRSITNSRTAPSSR